MKEYLTAEEIARRLDVNVQAVHHWIQQGKLPALTLEEAGYRIRQQDFDLFLQGQESQPHRSAGIHVRAPVSSLFLDNEERTAATAILEHLPDVFFRLDLQMRHLYISPAIERVTGQPPQAWLGKTAREIGLSEDIYDRFEALCQRVIATREAQQLEFFDNGHWQRSRIHPEYATDGSICAFIGITEDISERKQIEKALYASERLVLAERKRLRDLFMQAPAVITVFRGPNHIFELINPIAQSFLSIHQSVIGKTVREVLPEIESQEFLKLLDTVYQTGEPVVGNEAQVYLNRKGNGKLEEVYFNFVYQPSHNAAGKVDGVLVYAYEVTDIIRARKKAEESEERLHALAHSIPQLAWSARADGSIDFFNERLQDYTELSRSEDGIYDWQELVHPDDRLLVLRDWNQARQTGNAFEHEARLQMKDGTYRWHLVRGTPTRDENNNILRWYGTKTDIEQLRQLDQQKSHFLNIVSHELKTPITSTKAFAELIERRFRKDGDEKNAALLAKMNTQIKKLTFLISDLLNVTRLDTGKLTLHEADFAFDELVEEITEEIQQTTIHSILREGATNTTIYGDRERIGQVITNLLTNAIKYSPHKTKVIVTSSRIQQEIRFCVQDFGIGIARDKLPHIFERFFRESGPREDTYPGLGLGLYISSEIIQRHGGRIWVENDKGAGSTFCFALTLPDARS
ncbi:PAS domain-containing protein [Dictyobacter aurantiacus]|uniref:histidine kinase n=1 Tax=Dictyobacter aurantiacus TaxID=1936993 RepID=A0A401ZGL3_9CHLR|nr:PAS domain-containing protein [Dictyobacter aurantiacus]GCE06025.1 hypothetical protein KDAU_33540 [Dictyobacter aurantiacus]